MISLLKHRSYFSRIGSYLPWIAAIACCLAGLSLATDHTYQLVKAYNYLIGPVGDESYDTAHVIYPVITGQSSWHNLFTPFADHRVVIERLFMIYDFFFHDATGIMHPYRLAIILWSSFALLMTVIFRQHNFNTEDKLLLAGVLLSFLFAGISLVNYGSVIVCTWPFVIFFSIVSFMMAVHYSMAISHGQLNQGWFYLFLTCFFVVLTILTFNIGFMLWPVIFCILFKKHVLRRHFILWLFIAVSSFYAYFFLHHSWYTRTAHHGVVYVLKQPLLAVLYYCRLVSYPWLQHAQFHASFGTAVIGLCVTIGAVFFLLRYWLKKNLSNSETVIFACLLFSFLTLIIISIMRAWVEAEFVSLGMRFITVSLLFWFSFLTSLFVFYSELVWKSRLFIKNILFYVVTMVLLFIFIPVNGGVSEVSFFNVALIAPSISIPVNEVLTDNLKNYNGDTDIHDAQYNHQILKRYHKGPYQLWPTEQVGNRLDSLSFITTQYSGLVTLNILADLRQKGSPTLIIQARSSLRARPGCYLILTDEMTKIIGYGTPLANPQSLWQVMTMPAMLAQQSWQGVANTDLLRDNAVILKAWLVDTQAKSAIELGTMDIPAQTRHHNQ